MRAALPEPDLVRDVLEAPTDDAVHLSKRVIAALGVFAVLSAIARNGAAAAVFSPCFAGALIGFFAFRRPLRAVVVAHGLVSAGLVVARGEDGWGYLLAGAIVVVPLASVGALCAAALRRSARARAALAELGEP
jgi:hypothetical protein